MDIIASYIRRDRLIVELERRDDGRLGVALFDPKRQDWVRVWPSEWSLVARLRFWLAKWEG